MDEIINQFCIYCKNNNGKDVTENLNEFIKSCNKEDIDNIKENYFLLIKVTESYINACTTIQEHLILSN